MAFLDDEDDLDTGIGLVLAIAIYIESYGQSNYSKIDEFIQKIELKKRKDQQFLEAVERLNKA